MEVPAINVLVELLALLVMPLADCDESPAAAFCTDTRACEEDEIEPDIAVMKHSRSLQGMPSCIN